jgi:phage host-nuclease inhibitor protein Gam
MIDSVAEYEYEELVAAIAKEIRSADKEAAAMFSDLEKIRLEHADKISLHRDRIEKLFNDLDKKASRQKKKLTYAGKRKTIKVPAGEFGWRKTGDCVTVTDEEAVIRSLEDMNLGEFVKIEKSIRKNAILAKKELAERIEGISIGPREFFFVKPQGLPLISKQTNTRKK